MLKVYWESIFGRLALSEKQSESLFAFDSLLAELIVRAEACRVSVKCVRSIIKNNFQGVNSISVLVKIVSQVHLLC